MLRSVPRALLAGLVLVAAACSDRSPAPLPEIPAVEVPPPVHAELRCRIDVRARKLACAPAAPETAPGVSPLIIGGQGTNVLLTSTGTSYDSTTQILRSDVTVQNLMAQALGTTDGAFPAPEGVRVFFHSGPTVTQGTGAVSVANADGEEVFTSGQQKYFQYAGMLTTGSTTAPREWRFAVPPTVAFFAFTVFVAAPVAGPEAPSAGIVLLGGHGVTDTIDASPRTLLRIGVRGADGKPAANTGVVFEAIPIPGDPFWVEVWSGTTEPGSVPSRWTEVVTDSLGVARVRVRLGRRPGPGRLVVAVPGLELTDTARYTILPGNLKELRSFPADTTVVFGGRAPFRYATYDRVGNPRSGDPVANVTLAVSTGPGSAEGNEVVAGSTLGGVTAVATLGTLRDSSYVRVVPPLSIVASVTPMVTGETPGFYEFTLDGSDVRRLHVAQGAGGFADVTAEWLSPTRLLYAENRNTRTQLYVLDLGTGTTAPFRPAADWMIDETEPRVSRDGSWVYFSGGTIWNHYLYRVRADGTGREKVTPYESGPNESGVDPSPDGTRIAYVWELGASVDGAEVYVMDLAAREPTRLNLLGRSPRWSPDGTRIAYVSGEHTNGQRLVMVAAPDGSGARALSQSRMMGVINWSPDGKYIIAPSIFVDHLLIIEVATGNDLRVPYSGINGRLISAVVRP